MSFFRQLMIIALVPMTAWSGMSQVACRCSNGEIRLHCPKLNQSKLAVVPLSIASASQSSHGHQSTHGNSCCRGNGTTRSCCQTAKNATSQSERQAPACCAETCHCTPIVLAGNSQANLKAAHLPDVSQVQFVPITVSVIRLPRVMRVDLDSSDTGPGNPKDLIVFFERFLI